MIKKIVPGILAKLYSFLIWLKGEQVLAQGRKYVRSLGWAYLKTRQTALLAISTPFFSVLFDHVIETVGESQVLFQDHVCLEDTTAERQIRYCPPNYFVSLKIN